MAIDVTFPDLDFPHRGEFERSEFVNKQEAAQDVLADGWNTAYNTFKTQANDLETNVNNKEANVVDKHDIVVAKEALMNPHYDNIDIVAENIDTIGSKIGAVDIHNADSKTTPADNDELAILDSATTFSLKKLTFANLKDTLKTYFDTLYDLATVWVANDTRAKTALNASGDAPIYACRAWAVFNGTGTVAITSSGNISSLADNGTGKYTLNTISLISDSSVVSGNASGTSYPSSYSDGVITVRAKSTTSVSISTGPGNRGATEDNININVVITF